ncbi:MAG TPA: hypothetical protein VG709_04550 [Actinomycetota bacterium]|nr:hypothetical protein [Actinomycetota bacterium]
MDEEAFRPGTREEELATAQTVLMAGGPFKNKNGVATLTNDRFVFADQRFSAQAAGAAGGMLAGAVAGALEKRRSKGKPPMIDVPLTDVTRVAHEKKMTVRDILVIEAKGEEHRFAQGFKALRPLLRRALPERHGRNVVDDGEGFRVSG